MQSYLPGIGVPATPSLRKQFSSRKHFSILQLALVQTAVMIRRPILCVSHAPWVSVPSAPIICEGQVQPRRCLHPRSASWRFTSAHGQSFPPTPRPLSHPNHSRAAIPSSRSMSSSHPSSCSFEKPDRPSWDNKHMNPASHPSFPGYSLSSSLPAPTFPCFSNESESHSTAHKITEGQEFDYSDAVRCRESSTSALHRSSAPIHPALAFIDSQLPYLDMDRDLHHADAVWDAYASLSPFTRRNLRPEQFAHIVQLVVPSMSYIRQRFRPCPEWRAVEDVAEQLVTRILTITSDLKFNRIADTRSPPPVWYTSWLSEKPFTAQPIRSHITSCYSHAVRVVSYLGDYHTCEALHNDLSALLSASSSAICDDQQGELIGRRLFAITQYCHHHRRRHGSSRSVDISLSLNGSRLLAAIQRIVRDIEKHSLSGNRRVVKSLVKALHLAISNVFSSDATRQLDDILIRFLLYGYGLDPQYLTIDLNAKAHMTSHPLAALLGWLGRHGHGWKMVSAYELLRYRPFLVTANNAAVSKGDENLTFTDHRIAPGQSVVSLSAVKTPLEEKSSLGVTRSLSQSHRRDRHVEGNDSE
ncbi:hypothetical protein M231_00569 [Tremella mesenterica]|uniref:Uncharacterized protein n=1 Tax=Tremella mesenterica TaxID=5217 RepID=A0A4Q1BVQ1_TREME|nr:hypothetical protein M231_00569 [Tremella mesenterica]